MPTGRPITDLFSHYTADANGCWIWNGPKTGKGYPVIKRDGKTLRMHREFYRKFVGEIPDGMLMCHKCDVPSCVNPEHLFYGTPLDNVHDMIAKGRNCKLKFGEQHKKAKLTVEEVRKIKQRIRNGEAVRAIARDISMNHSTIRAIAIGQNWKNVE